MPLTTKDISSTIFYVHEISKTYMRVKTTYFVMPHEYVGAPFDCVGLFAFIEDHSIIFAVLSDGSIKELTPNYFPQHMINKFETHFKGLALRPV
jgi:hypothetical protein